MYQGTFIKSGRSSPVSLTEKSMKENGKQKHMIRCFLTVFEVEDQKLKCSFLSLSLALTCLNTEYVQVCGLSTVLK